MFLLLSSHDASITWYFKVNWQIKYVISSLLLVQWASHMARWWLNMRVFHPFVIKWDHRTNQKPQCLWKPKVTGRWQSEGLPLKRLHELLILKSCEITWQTKYVISPLPQCLKLSNVATWGLGWGISTYKVTRPLKQVVSWSHVTN